METPPRPYTIATHLGTQDSVPACMCEFMSNVINSMCIERVWVWMVWMWMGWVLMGMGEGVNGCGRGWVWM